MQFPAFLFGDEASVVARARNGGATVFGTLRAIAPGELVVVARVTLDPFTPQWRLVGVGLALDGASMTYDHVLATLWGALAACAEVRPSTIDAVTRRARSLLATWEPLATLRYIGGPRPTRTVTLPGFGHDAIGLDDLAQEMFAGPLAMWGPDLGSARARLEAALDAMATASRAEVRERLVTRMVSLARDNPRLTGTIACDRAAVVAVIDALADEDRASLEAGVSSALLSELYELARNGRPAS